jgi:protein phosphatase
MDKPVIFPVPNDRCVLMVADGMGGHPHGDAASRLVLRYLVKVIDRLSNPASCAEVIKGANQRLFEIMHEDRDMLGMGTTLVGAVLTAERLTTFNVGDSRCYLFSAGRLIQLSYDDVPEGESNHFGPRRSHALTQALSGASFPVAIEPHVTVDAPLAAGETLLLCSDGLTDMVTSEVISSTLRTANDPLRPHGGLPRRPSAGAHETTYLYWSHAVPRARSCAPEAVSR